MARERPPDASRRQRPPRWFRGLLLGVAGIVGGLLLGELVAGGRLGRPEAAKPSYADFSANPNAVPAGGEPARADCFDCPGRYEASARMRSRGDARDDDAFRELGAIELDTRYAEPDDEYRYGGAFPEPATGANDPPPDIKLSLPVEMTPAPTAETPPAGGDPSPPPSDR